MSDARVTYTLQESNGRKFRITGSAATRVLALGEANTKLALTVGSLLGGTVSEPVGAGEVGAEHAAGDYSDAEITMKHDVSGKLLTVHLENISNAYGDAATGIIESGQAAIDAFCAAYRDGQDAGGYSFYQGKFVR